MGELSNPDGWPGTDARPEAHALVASLRTHRDEIAALFEACSSHWGYEDPLYRFYHQSWKLFELQVQTERIVDLLRCLAPDRPLNPWFLEIVAAGTGLTFTMDHNRNWTAATRPIVEAFLHARFFLDMALRYSTLESPPNVLPSGYAALLYLYGLR
jgi:hypothetical protein